MYFICAVLSRAPAPCRLRGLIQIHQVRNNGGFRFRLLRCPEEPGLVAPTRPRLISALYLLVERRAVKSTGPQKFLILSACSWMPMLPLKKYIVRIGAESLPH